jgi:hypothetical protein
VVATRGTKSHHELTRRTALRSSNCETQLGVVRDVEFDSMGLTAALNKRRHRHAVECLAMNARAAEAAVTGGHTL